MLLDESESNEEAIENENCTFESKNSFVKIATIVAKTAQCKIEDVNIDSDLRELGVDSLDTLTLLFDLEEAFDIVIPNEIIPTIKTVNDILDKLDDLNS